MPLIRSPFWRACSAPVPALPVRLCLATPRLRLVWPLRCQWDESAIGLSLRDSQNMGRLDTGRRLWPISILSRRCTRAAVPPRPHPSPISPAHPPNPPPPPTTPHPPPQRPTHL